MALSAGSRLGPYEIAAQIGAGGMGEVYRATDTSLKRQVAIKVLPDAVAADAERLARFQREAEVLASLNHPNIAGIYGLERAGGQTALVMELVEGPTLADRIAEGPVAVAQALPIAKQIAEALEAAHEQGIVHRDLKPANIKVRPDGTVKVLDFGLAKALAPEGASATAGSQSLSPTITTPAMTQAGVLLGTAAYMAPEQARGTPADRRADVWAFGCVLFEMLTGRPVFDGKTVSDVLAGVLRADPDWTSLPPLHPRLRLLLERCLARDLRDRYQGIADARVDIESVADDPEGAALETSPGAPGASAPASRRWLLPVAVAVAAVVLSVLATLAFILGSDAGDDRVVRLAMSPPDGMVFGGSNEAIPFAVSPDGRAIAFAAFSAGGSPRLFVQELDEEAAEPLQGTENATGPFWSPDSEWVGFYADGFLKRVRRTGGAVEPIVATRATGAGGSAWSTNGTILFKSGRFEAPWLGVSDRGGAVTEVTHLAEGEGTHVWATFLPDGNHFLHRVNSDNSDDFAARGIYLASLDGAEPRLLLGDGDQATRGLAHVPGFILFVRDGTLVARRFDEDRMEVLDDEFRLVSGVGSGAGAWEPWSVSAGGLLAVWGRGGLEQVLRWYGRDGSAVDAVDTPRNYQGFSLSPDGSRVAFSYFVGNTRDVWVRNLARGEEDKLTLDGDSFSPIWSPDGTRLAFASSMDDNVPDVYVIDAAGGNAEQITARTDDVELPGSWRGDGEIAYMTGARDGDQDLWHVSLGNGAGEPLSFNGPLAEFGPQLSPDGSLIAYTSGASGRLEVRLARYPSGADAVTVSTDGGHDPMWNGEGTELYYLNDGQDLMEVAVEVTPARLVPGRPSRIFTIPDTLPTGGPYANLYAPSPDGQRFLVSVLPPEVRQPPLRVVVNWQALIEE